jgi:hypothetical protein
MSKRAGTSDNGHWEQRLTYTQPDPSGLASVNPRTLLLPSFSQVSQTSLPSSILSQLRQNWFPKMY